MTDKKLLSRLASLTPEQREALLKQLKKKKSEGAEPRKDTITPFERRGNDRVAMSYAQQRLWFIDQLQSGSASYNISAALRLKGALDVEAMFKNTKVQLVKYNFELDGSGPSMRH